MINANKLDLIQRANGQSTNPYAALDDIGAIGSQDPADQPTAEDFAAISRFIQQMKQQRAAEAAQQLLDQTAAQKKAA